MISTRYGERVLNFFKHFSNQFYSDLFGYSVERTELELVPRKNWRVFCNNFGLPKNSRGVFFPRTQTAVVELGTNGSALDLFHEFFGHGLYCERTQIGRRIVDLERDLLEEERRKFRGKTFTSGELNTFRENSFNYNLLRDIQRQDQRTYEGFAVFTEFLLAKLFGLEEDFSRVYSRLNEEQLQTLKNITDFYWRFGPLSTGYFFGLERKPTPDRTLRLLKEVYGTKLDGASFAVLYGSRKPFSDVDVFLVSSSLKESFSEWADFRVCSPLEFECALRNFDIAVTDPILSGEFVCGDRAYLEAKKNQLQTQPITSEAIKYNFLKSEEQRVLAHKYPEDSRDRKRGIDYSATYLLNALSLREGRRVLTRAEMLLYLDDLDK